MSCNKVCNHLHAVNSKARACCLSIDQLRRVHLHTLMFNSVLCIPYLQINGTANVTAVETAKAAGVPRFVYISANIPNIPGIGEATCAGPALQACLTLFLGMLCEVYGHGWHILQFLPAERTVLGTEGRVCSWLMLPDAWMFVMDILQNTCLAAMCVASA